MMKISKLLLLIAFIIINSLSANSQDTTFYRKYGHLLYEINPADNGAFTAYFSKTHSIALEGTKLEGRSNGKMTFYYQNGKVKEVANFDRGKKQGKVEKWYKNGQKLGDFHHLSAKQKKHVPIDQNEVILNLYDSIGNAVVTDGYGEGFFLNNRGKVSERGSIKDGLRDGIWEGTITKKHFSETPMTYSDEYKLGKFVKGESKDTEGNLFRYDKVIETPKYQGGLKKWNRFLSRNLEYPKNAQRKGVQGKVFVQFFVEKDGSPTNIKVVKGIGAGCDEEAVRVVQFSDNWIPGLFRGQIAKIKLIQVIAFKFKDNYGQ